MMSQVTMLQVTWCLALSTESTGRCRADLKWRYLQVNIRLDAEYLLKL